MRYSSELIPGDIVRLKSGGNRMSVEYVARNGCISTVWFVGCELRREVFDPSFIEKCEAEQKD
jgi:uncharacterized protein YodC (DUF2158 family)